MKFIELTLSVTHRKLMVNVSQIIYFLSYHKNESETVIFFNSSGHHDADATVIVSESYNHIKNLICL